MTSHDSPTQPREPPSTFLGYLRSFGPGIMIVLTWLGAGDIVEAGVAGGNYGYALMWVIVIALLMRFLFVSLIAKYQLCNQHGEGVLDGLSRIHASYPIVLCVAAALMGHVYGAYMTVGLGEACVNITGRGKVWHWALLWNLTALAIVFRPLYQRIEWVFKILLGLLSISFLGSAIWIGPDYSELLKGTLAFKLPPTEGSFSPLLIAVGMIGAVGGSMMNLAYPYFLEAKGWRGPQFRRIQMYDFLLAICVIIVLDLAVWTLGAELLHPNGLTIENMNDLPRLLSEVLGNGGRILFYLGICAAIFTSMIGNAMGLGCLGSHGWIRWKAGVGNPIGDFKQHKAYQIIVVICLLSPMPWAFQETAGFVRLALVANSAQVVLIPFIAGGLWWITAKESYIGKKHRNVWWENLIMGFLFILAIWGAWGAVTSVIGNVFGK